MRKQLALAVVLSRVWIALGFASTGIQPVVLRKTSSLSGSNVPSDSDSQPEPFRLPNRSRRTQKKDIVIVGAGLAGLSTALYVSQLDPDRRITIVDKQEHDVQSKKKSTIGSFAAAGMLAPQSERLPKGMLLDLCLASRRMYPEFCDLVESLARESGPAGVKFLLQRDLDEATGLDPWSVGYMATGGFLAPAFAGDSVATWAPPDQGGTATWLDQMQIRELEPHLHPDVVGGWWFPEDASVDARRLTCSLFAACAAAGIEFLCGEGYQVQSLDLTDQKCHGLWLQNGTYLASKVCLVANGAWMRHLLPVPISPHKGQSLSLQMPSDRPPILRRVLFAQDSYIVPKADGHIVIGATVEAGSFDGSVTPAGLLHILTHALQLVPGLRDLPIAETWAGLRPTTPDKGPILGQSPWQNLFLAGGYWRNGVLLAPKTAQLLACLITQTELGSADQELLEAFSWNRFTKEGGGAAMAVQARYAASMHPIHSRMSGTGVAAAVGTELGSYSTAKAAKEERQKERSSLWGDVADGEDAFERAAVQGKNDAANFSMGNAKAESKAPAPATENASTSPQDATPSAEETSQETPLASDIDLAYETIKKNQAKRVLTLPEEEPDNRPDPGFRVYYADPSTGEKIEVPPYTSPGKFKQSLRKGLPANSSFSINMGKNESKATTTATPTEAILLESKDARPSVEEASRETPPAIDVALAYETIKKNQAKRVLTLPEEEPDNRPDPGFRVYYGDPSTGEKIEVPPYTSPGMFKQSLRKGLLATINTGVAEPPLVNVSTNGAENKMRLNSVGTSNKTTYDGYSDIQEANGTGAVKDQIEAMRKARQSNRNGQDSIDETNIGAVRSDASDDQSSPMERMRSLAEAKKTEDQKKPSISSEGLNGVWGKFAANGDLTVTNMSEYNEKTYDGYQTILEANSGQTRADELEAMRRARALNRIGSASASIDESKLN